MEGMVCMRRTVFRVPRFAFRGRPPEHRTRNLALTSVLVLLAGIGCGGSPKTATEPGGTGALAVQVSGLPGGTAARVTVTAPDGGATTVTGSQVLTGLAAGVYGLSAGYVTAQSQTWTPQLSVTSVTVAAADTASVLVSYPGGPATSLDLRVSGAQLIQSTQRADGSVPMVAGRDALLRVFVTANSPNQAQPSVRVRLFAGGTQVDSLTIPAPKAGVPTSVDTASLGSSWNVLIPAARVVGGMAVQALVDPDDGVAETDEADNLWPGANPQGVTVRSVPAFSLRFVPVKQSVNNLTGQVSNANKAALAEDTRRMHPLGVTNVDVRSTYVTGAPVLMANDSNGAWGRILGEVYALRNADGFQGDYVGIVPATYGGGIAGLGYVGGPAAVAWDKSASAPGVIAHELGHNFGRSHAPCGNPGGPDPQYPYANASIGTWGLDLPALQLKAPGTYKDLMSYCNPDWISDYNYLAVLSFRGTAPAVEPAAGQQSAEGLMVWGRIRNGSVILEPSFAVHAPVQLPPRPGPHRVEGFDVSGRRVFGVSFEGTVVADLPGGEERHFAFVVPLAASERAALATVQLVGDGVTVRQSRAGLRASPAATGPAAIRRGDELEIRWDPSYPLAVIRDARSGAILSFARNGLGRVPATGGAVTVELSEGVSSLPGVALRAP
jgi:hypothetical protein